MDPLRLVGAWDFRREIRHADGAEYTAAGVAEFVLQDDGRVRWSEHGTLTWAAGSTPVSRTLFLVREPADADATGAARANADLDAASDGTQEGPDAVPSRWRVTFEDGRDFHPWTAGAVEHLCGRDLYAGGVKIPARPAPSSAPSSDPPWELTWRVTGPEKDYTTHTTYSRPAR